MKSVRVLGTMAVVAWRWRETGTTTRLPRHLLDLLRMQLSDKDMGEEHSRHAQQHINAGECQQEPSYGSPFPGGGSRGPRQKQLTLRVLD